LCTAAFARGDVVDAARRSADLVAHWLRAGAWTQLWTTLRHAASILADHDPALALAVLDAADADPYAPSLDDAARVEAAALRARLLAHLGHAPDGRSDRLVRTDRTLLAERVRTALRTLTDALEAASDGTGRESAGPP
jgi:hypothetical protein